jgi:hypothetical protein
MMKHSVQTLLLAACVVALDFSVQAETMEERKQRIMRKYLRERTTITQGGAMVPQEYAEDEMLAASDKFKQAEVDLQRQEPGVAPPPPPPRRPPPRTEDRNWLLAEDPELEDPYADPFAFNTEKDESGKKADWTTWETERESSTYRGIQRETRFGGRRGAPAVEQPASIYESMRQGFSGMRDPRAAADEGMQQGFTQPGSRSPYTAGGLDLSQDKTYNSTFNQSRLQSPFPRAGEEREERSFGSGAQQRRDGYTPYKSPYQTQRDQRSQQWGGYREPQQEFRKQDPFQTWKDKNPTRFDPTRDDAFIDEVMPKTRH